MATILVAACSLVSLAPSLVLAGNETDRPIRLPPFVVYGSRLKVAHWKWGYMAFPGYEVLSSCGAGATSKFVRNIASQIAILRDIAPVVLESPTSVPTALILMNQEQANAISDDMRRVMEERPSDSKSRSSGAYSHAIYFPQLRLHDSESTAINVVLGPTFGEAVILEPGYIQYLMENRVPRLPAWYVQAMTDLYRRAVFNYVRGTPNVNGSRSPDSIAVTYPPVTWPSVDNATDLLPMDEILFGSTTAKAGDEASRRRILLWQFQSDLLLQWVIADESRLRITALRKFLDCGKMGQGNEKAFIESFGFGFEEMRRQLRGFLSAAISDAVVLHSWMADLDEPYRDATPSESVRIWGNWELMEIQFVRAQNPLMVYPYVEQAERTLFDAYNGGERDSGFLAVFGLYESDRKDLKQASAILESAVAERSIYPSAYTELARIRFEEALARPEGGNAKLSDNQVRSILELLRQARRLCPPQNATYLLFALALGNSSVEPTAEEFAMLEEGRQFFPDDSALAKVASALKKGLGGAASSPEDNIR
jgi:hypothetical protein